MPYKGEDGAVSMYVMLPNENSASAVDKLLGALTTKNFEEMLGAGWEQKVNVEFPKFEVEASFTLDDVN